MIFEYNNGIFFKYGTYNKLGIGWHQTEIITKKQVYSKNISLINIYDNFGIVILLGAYDTLVVHVFL